MATTKFESGKRYKLAIVLGGFVDRQSTWFDYTDRSGRLMDAIRGYKTGQIEKILITGDASTWNVKNFCNYMRPFGVPDSAFIFEQRATNTRENAVYTLEIIRGKYSDKETVLFTNATHMKRSLACFAKVGFYPDYISVDTHQCVKYRFTSYLPSWRVMDDWFSIFKEWFGYGWYKVRGWC